MASGGTSQDRNQVVAEVASKLFAAPITAANVIGETLDRNTESLTEAQVKAGLAAAIDAGSFATDRAVDLARQGVPFRDAYRQIAADLEAGAGLDPGASLSQRVSPGAPGDPRSDRQRARLQALGARLAEATSGGGVA
jgi:hypothetical protein